MTTGGSSEIRGETDRMDERELVGMVRCGAPAAFDGLVRRHAPRVQRIVRSILRDDPDVDDVVQQAFLRAFVAFARFEGASSFARWLGRIAVNEALLRLRMRRRTAVPAPSADSAAAPGPGPEQHAAARESLALVLRALPRLSARDGEIFLLRHVEGLSIAQAAARLGISETAAKLRLHRTRRRLRLATAARPPHLASSGSGAAQLP